MSAEEKLEQLLRKISERPRSQQTTESIYWIPSWRDWERGVPNAILRSALFAASTKRARRYVEREQIHSQKGISIFHTGPALGQGELDVWETVIQIASVSQQYPEIRTSIYQLLKLQNKTDAGSNRRLLHDSLVRLKASAVDIKQGQYRFLGSLIDEAFRDEDSGEYVIRLDPNLRNLFAKDAFTRVDWQVRRALSGKPLAQWLHGFYSSHAKAFTFRVKTLMRLAGSSDQSTASSEQNLRRALDALAKASSVNGQPFSYSISDGKVHVDKLPTPSQIRHLRSKAGKPKPIGVRQHFLVP